METDLDIKFNQLHTQVYISAIEKAKKDKNRMNQIQMFTLYGNYLDDGMKSNY